MTVKPFYTAALLAFGAAFAAPAPTAQAAWRRLEQPGRFIAELPDVWCEDIDE